MFFNHAQRCKIRLLTCPWHYKYAAVCDEQCSLHGGVCDNGVCEFRCSDYAGYTCQNSSTLLSSLSVCKNVLGSDTSGQHCAPSEPSILQQLEEVVVMPNYHRLFPGGARKLFNILGNTYCDEAAKRLACWVCSFQTFFLHRKTLVHIYLIFFSLQYCTQLGTWLSQISFGFSFSVIDLMQSSILIKA